MNELAKDVKSSKEKGCFTLETQEKLFEAGIVVFKLVLKRIKSCFAPCWYFCLFMIQYA